jgi:predicted DNA-binding transcriptional regulator AlpA
VGTELTLDLATPAEVAHVLRTTEANLAQMRYRGNGPRFVRAGRRRVLYRWADVEEWIADALRSRSDE